jgi:hypothetical protein
MIFRNKTVLAVTLSVLFTGFAARADDSFVVTVKGTDLQRMPPPLRVFVDIGKMKFAFLTPDGFRVRDDALMQRVVMEGTTKDCNIIFRKRLPLDEGTTYRDMLLARYPGSKITGESSRKVCGNNCPIYDLEWVKDGVIHYARIAFISSGAGPLEVDSVGTADVKQFIGIVLSTFVSSDEDGNLVVPPIHDQT